MDISKLSMSELRELQQQLPLEMERREVREMRDLLNEVRSIANDRGYTLEELVALDARLSKGTATGSVKVKYRHPDNPELQWTGRGRKPRWVQSWLENGGSMENLAV